MDFNRFQWISMDFIEFQWISIDFNEFQWISMDFNEFQWISLDFNEFARNFNGFHIILIASYLLAHDCRPGLQQQPLALQLAATMGVLAANLCQSKFALFWKSTFADRSKTRFGNSVLLLSLLTKVSAPSKPIAYLYLVWSSCFSRKPHCKISAFQFEMNTFWP